MDKPVLVNIGCGRVWHPYWINLDHQPTSPEVRPFDLRKPLPFESGTVDAVYASHLLEHLDRTEGARLMQECRRVLKPGGIVRIVVPDLEDLCKFYLQRLNAVCERPTAKNETSYDWAYLQLLDQHVRRRTGGELVEYLDRPGLIGNDDIRDRLSNNVRILLEERARRDWIAPSAHLHEAQEHRPAAQKRFEAIRSIRGRIRDTVVAVARRVLPGSLIDGLETTAFLRLGELHRVGYDRFSLPRLLEQAGFDNVAVLNADQSSIPGFTTSGLDTVDGRPRKPGSLFVEARRPLRSGITMPAPVFEADEVAARRAERQRRTA